MPSQTIRERFFARVLDTNLQRYILTLENSKAIIYRKSLSTQRGTETNKTKYNKNVI